MAVREYSYTFRKKLFSSGKVYEELFNDICKAGSDAETLGGLLFAVCTLAVGDRKGFLDRGRISTAERQRLTRDLLRLADLVERVNLTSLNPKLDILCAPPDAGRDPIRKHVAGLYDKLPSIMRMYSFHLERFSKFRKVLLKRLTLVHLETLRLRLYVQESTGSSRYEDMSNLLTGGFLAAGGAEDTMPTFFTADALAKLKLRTAKFGLTSRF